MPRHFNRRQFNKTLFAAGAASPLLIRSVTAQESKKSRNANDELTIAAIGVGGSRGKYKRGTKIAMEGAAALDAPLEVTMGHGRNWLDAH